MQFTIDNATILGFSQNGTFFGGDFRFGNKRLISLECLSTDISNESEVTATAVRSLITLSKTDDYLRVHINGISFDTVKFTSFNIDGDDWVRGAKCSIELEAYDEGTIESNLGGDYYKGLDFQGLAHFLDDFSEDFDFQRSENSISYTHALSLKFSDAAEFQSPSPRLTAAVALAKEFAGKLFKTKAANRPDFAFNETQLQSLYKTFDDDYHRAISEEYDNINNTCTFTENFQAFDSIAGDNSYSTTASRTFDYGPDGIINVKEQGQILGLLEANYEAAEAALDTVIAGATGNLNTLFSSYSDITKSFETCAVPALVQNEGGTGPRIITQGRTINIYEGLISYNLELSNDPSKGPASNYNYTSSVRLDGDYFTASEQGTIEGIEEPLAAPVAGGEVDHQKFDQALVRYSAVDSNIDTRVTALLTNPSPQYITNNETMSHFKGSITYNRAFSNAPRYADNNGVAKQITTDTRNTEPAVRHTVENIINSPLYEQGANQAKEGGAQLVQLPMNSAGNPVGYSLSNLACDINIVGKRDSSLSDLLDLAKGAAKPGLNYLKSCEYSFNDENSMKLNVNFGWE